MIVFVFSVFSLCLLGFCSAVKMYLYFSLSPMWLWLMAIFREKNAQRACRWGRQRFALKQLKCIVFVFSVFSLYLLGFCSAVKMYLYFFYFLKIALIRSVMLWRVEVSRSDWFVILVRDESKFV